jgi:hypothetical protein
VRSLAVDRAEMPARGYRDAGPVIAAGLVPVST